MSNKQIPIKDGYGVEAYAAESYKVQQNSFVGNRNKDNQQLVSADKTVVMP